MTFHDAILSDLLESYAATPPYESVHLEQCYQNMGFWLAQVRNEDDCSRWILRWIYAIEAKYPGTPMVVCSYFVQEHITQALAQAREGA